MSRLRLGWIGCGTHANEMLLPQITRFDVTLAALCDVDEGRLNASGVPARSSRRRNGSSTIGPR